MSVFIRPPLKWAGGKYRLLDRILAVLPDGERLVEPFIGSGVVFLNTHYSAYLLCDKNEDLILFYQNLAAGAQAFIRECARLFTPEHNTKEVFYSLRARFNTLPLDEERAQLFLYLNRHSYNGLVRYNAKGGYNAPFGRYKSPYFPRREMEALVQKCAIADVRFAVQAFSTTFAALAKGDVVYCDPPYVPLSATAHFTAYTGSTFTEPEQQDLAGLALEANALGIPVLISNHDTPFTRQLYSPAQITSFSVQRFISCHGANRAKAQEILALFTGSSADEAF